MKPISIIGGDARMLYLAQVLEESGYACLRCGTEPSVSAEELARNLEAPGRSDVILPLPASRDGKHICTAEPFEPVSLAFLCERLKKGDRVFAGKLEERVRRRLEAGGAAVTDYYDEDFVLENARLTARCIPAVLREATDAPPSSLRIAVTGYGRTGSAAAKLLSGLGAKVTVFVRRAEAVRQAQRDGLSARPLPALREEAAGFDLLLNTVPARIIGEDVLGSLTAKTLLMELASRPFGADYSAARAYGVRVLLAPSLPGRYAPREAGGLLGEKIKRLL